MLELWVQNLAAHWLQAACLAAGAAAAAAALRLRHPGIRLLLWQGVLALTVALPWLQPWQSIAAHSAYLPGGLLAVATVSMHPDAAASSTAWWPYSVTGAVLVGIVLRLAWIALGLARLRQLRTLPPLAPGVVAEIDAAMREIGAGASIRLGENDGPLSFGALKPIIVIPSSFWTLDSQARRAVALHELIHVRRRDAGAALVEEILFAALWFHPWSWWVRAQIRLAREETVDREVVARMGAREAYAVCLLSMAGYEVAGTQAGVALMRRRELRHRVDALFQEVAMSRARFAATACLLGSVLGGATAAAVSAFPLASTADATPAAQSESPRRVLQMVPPQYPEGAGGKAITGTVSIEVTVNAAGAVSGFGVIGGPPALRDSAITAVRQWKFEPARAADVVIVDVEYRLTVREGRQVRGWSFAVRERGEAAPLRVGGDVSAPKVTKEVKAVFPPDAKAAGVQGSVYLEATIGVDGKVGDLNVTRSVPELDAAAVEAIRQWEFEPGRRNGAAVPVVVEIEIKFTLK